MARAATRTTSSSSGCGGVSDTRRLPPTPTPVSPRPRWASVLAVDRHGNKDPVFGVIGIQSGPREQRVHSGFHGGQGSRFGDAGSGDDRKDPSGLFRAEEADQGDLPGVSALPEGRAQGDPVGGDRVSL